MKSLRKDFLAIYVTLLALISQMFFGVVHATSVWTAAAGPVAQVEVGSTSYQFLQICSAGGLVTLDADDGSPRQFNPNNCPVCASCVTAPILQGEGPIWFAVTAVWGFDGAIQNDHLLVQGVASRVFARGPPPLLSEVVFVV